MGTRSRSFSGVAFATLGAMAACQQSTKTSSASSATSAASATAGASASAPAPSVEPSAPAENVASPAPAEGQLGDVYIDSMDWRGGGRALFLRADGGGVLRVTGGLENNAQNEKRYDLPADPARRAAIEDVLRRHQAIGMKVDAEMAPGDAVATVLLRAGAKDEVVARGPLSRNPGFAKLFADLEPLVNAIDISGLRATYDGGHEPNWKHP